MSRIGNTGVGMGGEFTRLAINLTVYSTIEAPLRAARRLIMGFANFVRRIGRTLLNPLTIGFSGLGAALPIIQFEKLNIAMARSMSIMGDVSFVMEHKLRMAAIESSKATQFSATQAAESYRFMASAGYDAQQSLKMLPVVAQFAQAGMFDLSQAVNYLADSQVALGMRVQDPIKNMENMARVADVLTKANIIANGEVEDFAAALQNKAGGAMRLVNMEIEEGVAVLAAFADQGIKGQAAGTALGIVLRDLQTKAIKNEATFRQFGIGVFDAGGNLNNMSSIIADLEKKLDGLSDKAKKQVFLDLGFQDRSVQFLQTLVGTSERIKQYEEDLRSAGGATRDVAERSMTPLQKALAQLRGEFQMFSEAAAPVVDMLAQITTGAAMMLGSGTAQKMGQRIAQWVIKATKFILDGIQKIIGATLSIIAEVKELVRNIRNSSFGTNWLGIGYKGGEAGAASQAALQGIQRSQATAQWWGNQPAWSKTVDHLTQQGQIARLGQQAMMGVRQIAPKVSEAAQGAWDATGGRVGSWLGGVLRPVQGPEMQPDPFKFTQRDQMQANFDNFIAKAKEAAGALGEFVAERKPAFQTMAVGMGLNMKAQRLRKQLERPTTEFDMEKTGSAASYTQRVRREQGVDKDRLQKEIRDLEKKSEEHLGKVVDLLRNPPKQKAIPASGL